MIRIADEFDHNAIYSLLQQFYLEVPHSAYTGWTDEKVHACIDEYLQAERSDKIVFLAEKDGDVFGMLSALAAPVFFGVERRAYESIWFVKEGYRFQPDSLRLLDAYEYWAKHVHCTTVALATMGHDPRLERYYNKRGYKKLETSFIKVLHGN